jgi:hypothetical protein
MQPEQIVDWIREHLPAIEARFRFSSRRRERDIDARLVVGLHPNAGGLRWSEIADRVEPRRDTAPDGYLVLKRLETDGLIKRRRDKADDRVVQNWLTARARTLRTRAVDIPTQLLCSTTVELDEASRLRAALNPVLDKLVAHKKP